MGIGWTQRPVQVQAISVACQSCAIFVLGRGKLEQTALRRELSELHGERAHPPRLSLIDSLIPSVTLSCAHLFIKSPSCPIPGALICTVFYIKRHSSTSGRVDMSRTLGAVLQNGPEYMPGARGTVVIQLNVGSV